MKNETSRFIDSVITSMMDRKNDGVLAATIQDMDHAEIGNRILIARARLARERLLLKSAGRSKEVVAPEPLLRFCQQVMNTACYRLRRLRIEQEAAGAEDAAAGVDFSERYAEEICVEGRSNDKFDELIADVFSYMTQVHSHLAKAMNYLEQIDDLYVFQVSEPVPDPMDETKTQWIVTGTANTFTESLGVMEQALASLKERTSAEEMESAYNVDFTTGEVLDSGLSLDDGPVRTRRTHGHGPVTRIAPPAAAKAPGFVARLFGLKRAA